MIRPTTHHIARSQAGIGTASAGTASPMEAAAVEEAPSVEAEAVGVAAGTPECTGWSRSVCAG